MTAGAVARLAGDVVLLVSTVAATAGGWLVSRRPTVARRSRLAWRWIAGGFALIALSLVAFGLGELTGATPWFAAGSALRLAATPLMLVGLLTSPAPARNAAETGKILLDVGIVAVSGLIVLWYFVIGPALTRQVLAPPVIANAVALPIGDLLLMFAALIVVLRGTTAAARRPALIFAAGLGLTVCGDLFVSYQNSRGTFALETPWPMAFWLPGHLLLAAAAVDRYRRAATPVGSEDDERPAGPPRLNLLPYAAIAVAYALLLSVALRAGLYPWGGLVIGLGVMTGIVVVRQVVALRENRDLVFTDPLTRVANRVRLHDDLRRALHRTRRGGTAAVLLLDMNEFKQINDSLGHAVGDDLLVGFARLLTSCVLGSDTVSRLGGDEFAVVLNDCDAVGAVAVAERIVAAMAEPMRLRGHVVYPKASIGIAVGDPLDQPSDLLGRADTAMYRAKRSGTNRWALHAVPVG